MTPNRPHPPLFRHRKGFPGKGRLVNAQVIAFDKLHIGGNDISEAKANQVARHEIPRIYFLPFTVPERSRLQGKLLLQGFERV